MAEDLPGALFPGKVRPASWPPSAMAGPMTETREADFTAKAAAEVLAGAATYEDALRRRTEGLTNMVWGITSAGIFTSYALLAVTGVLAGADAPEAVYAMLWAPWVLCGVLTTKALWRSASLAAPKLDVAQPPGYKLLLAWVGAYVVLGGGAFLLVPRMNEPTYALLAMGLGWTVFGALNLFRCSRAGRNVSVATGAVILAAAVALAAALPTDRDLGYAMATWVSIAVSGAVPVAGGLWHQSRD